MAVVLREEPRHHQRQAGGNITPLCGKVVLCSASRVWVETWGPRHVRTRGPHAGGPHAEEGAKEGAVRPVCERLTSQSLSVPEELWLRQYDLVQRLNRPHSAASRGIAARVAAGGRGRDAHGPRSSLLTQGEPASPRLEETIEPNGEVIPLPEKARGEQGREEEVKLTEWDRSKAISSGYCDSRCPQSPGS